MPIPTPRLLFLVLLGAVPIVLSTSSQVAVLIAAGWLAGCLGVALADMLSVAGPEDLLWTRAHDEKLSLGAPNEITLTLRNQSRRVVTFRLRDATAVWMKVSGSIAAGRCEAGSSWTHSYSVVPVRRGSFVLGPLTYRLLGPLGLAWRQREALMDDGVAVYPNLAAVRRYEALAARGALTQIGVHVTRKWGEGSELERLREYAPDDDVRRIHWKATARRGAPVAVEYETERSQNVIIMLDCGRLMATKLSIDIEREDTREVLPGADTNAYSPLALTRLDHAVNAATLLAYVSQRYGDRVGLLAYSDRVLRYISPRRGHQHFLRIVDALYNLEPEPVEPDIGVATAHLEARHRRRSLIVLFTDLAEPEAAAQLVPRLHFLARRHLPLATTLRDPDIEALAALPVDSADHVYQRAVASDVLHGRDTVLQRLRSAGVLTLDVVADRLSATVINRYLEVKSRGRL